MMRGIWVVTSGTRGLVWTRGLLPWWVSSLTAGTKRADFFNGVGVLRRRRAIRFAYGSAPLRMTLVGFAAAWLVQLLVLGFCLFQDGQIRIGIFPGGEEVLVGGLSCCGVALQGVGSA